MINITMLFIFLIVAVSITGEVVKTIVKNKNKRLEIEHTILKDEIRLEEIKQKNYLLETEKLRLELKQVQSNSPTKAELLNFKQIEPDVTEHKSNPVQVK